MPLLEFETCRQRIERAREHSLAFGQLWNDIVGDGAAYRTILHIQDDGTGGVWIEPREDGFPVAMSLEFGEFLYQLRGALDACVYNAAILETGKDPPPDDDKLEFPICSDSDKFKKASWKIEPLTGKRRHIVESIQPYNAPPNLRDDIRVLSLHRTLGILNDWARKDRHRKLHLIGGWASRGNPRFLLPEGVELDWLLVTYDGLLEHDSQIASFKLSGYTSDAQSKVKVNPDLFVDVSVGEPPEPCADNDTLVNRMRMMIATVAEIVHGIEDSFIEERKASQPLW
jgi:hypothetical protein